jgi:hypothetical protein
MNSHFTTAATWMFLSALECGISSLNLKNNTALLSVKHRCGHYSFQSQARAVTAPTNTSGDSQNWQRPFQIYRCRRRALIRQTMQSRCWSTLGIIWFVFVLFNDAFVPLFSMRMEADKKQPKYRKDTKKFCLVLGLTNMRLSVTWIVSVI